MKVKHDFRNGQRYLFIEAETDSEKEFCRNFFESPEEIEEQLSPVPGKKSTELIFAKGM